MIIEIKYRNTAETIDHILFILPHLSYDWDDHKITMGWWVWAFTIKFQQSPKQREL